MAENNLGSTQYFRSKPDQEALIEVKEILKRSGVQCDGTKRDTIL